MGTGLSCGTGRRLGKHENTSSRLWKIEDVGGERWTLNYNADAVPHLTSVTGPPGAGKTVVYVTSAIQRPDGVAMGNKTMLSTVTHANLPLTTTFTYTTYAELSKVVTSYGGELQWDYALFTYASNVRLREVSQRRLSRSPSYPLPRITPVILVTSRR